MYEDEGATYLFQLIEIVILRSDHKFHEFLRMQKMKDFPTAHLQEAILERTEGILYRVAKLVSQKQINVFLPV